MAKLCTYARSRSCSRFLVVCIMAISCTLIAPVVSLTEPSSTRRSFLVAFPCLFASSHPASASLDMDAFMNAELAKDADCGSSNTRDCTPRKKLTDDEALCKYGQPSRDRGDACVRAGVSTKLKPGGVDAYGKLDRGDFVKCKQFYEMENGQYVKKTECK